MRVIGLSAGNADGSAEILLKAALAAAAGEGAEVALVRLDDLELPTRPVGPGAPSEVDDGEWLWDQLMESSGLIVAAPIYSRTVPGKLKLVADRLSGPAADVAFAESYRQMLEAGTDSAGGLSIRRAGVPPARGRSDRGGRRAYQPVEITGAARNASDDVLFAHSGGGPAAGRRRRDAAGGRARRRRSRGGRAGSAAASGNNSDARSRRSSTAEGPVYARSVICPSSSSTAPRWSAPRAAPPVR